MNFQTRRRLRVLLLIGAALFSSAAADAAPRARKFQFQYKAVVRDIPAGTKDFRFWLPVPHDSPFQKITNLKIDSPYKYRIQTAQYGNKMLYINVKEPLERTFTVSLSFDAVRTEHVRERLGASETLAPDKEDRDPNMRRWLEADRLVPVDGQIKQWAQEVVEAAGAKTDLERARAIYNHIIATVKYDKSGKGWGRGDIYYACDARAGNCTDFHAIFIGYARALGIPARFAIGFPLPADRGAGEISGYHCWAEFYIKGVGWIPVDASEAAKNPSKREYFFGAHDENRVEFSVGRDLKLKSMQAADPLNYFVYPYAESAGSAFATVERTVSYRDATENSDASDAKSVKSKK